MQSAYQISIGGNNVTSAFSPLLISLTITESDGGNADTCEIELDDSYGQIALPSTGDPIEALVWWVDPAPGCSSGALQFTGTVDEVKSKGSRKAGRTLVVTGRSADMRGKGKHKHSKHYDNQSFQSVAQDVGAFAGYQVSVDSALGATQRDFWLVANESFLSWGRRVAEELGATFKVAFPQAAFVPRNSGDSAGGAPLPGFTATWGENLISWDVSPTLSSGVWGAAKAAWYDVGQAAWNEVSQPIGSGAADHRGTFKHASRDRAQQRAGSNADDAKRKAAACSIEAIGDPGAQAQANVTISGARPGVDGDYRIKTARHKLDRHGGWIVHCECEQPQGAAGTDSRDADDSSSADTD